MCQVEKDKVPAPRSLQARVRHVGTAVTEMTRRETAETHLGIASGCVGCPASGQGAASLGHDGLSTAFQNVCTFPGHPESQVWALDGLLGGGVLGGSVGCRLLSLSQFLSEKKFQEVAFYNFICLVLGAVQGHYCYVGSSLVVVRGLLAAAAPRCGAWALGRVGSVAAAPGLESTGSVVVARA